MASRVPQYCKQCSWLFDKAGACQAPDTYLIFSLISFLPYLIMIVFIALGIIFRRERQIKIAGLLVSAYIIGDRILKNLVQDHRPIRACKTTFGFPSSHMVVICCYAFYLMPRANLKNRTLLLLAIVTQAYARVHLHYHTWFQVFGGIFFALAYTPLFIMLFKTIEKLEFVQKVFNFIGVKYHQEKHKKHHHKQVSN